MLCSSHSKIELKNNEVHGHFKSAVEGLEGKRHGVRPGSPSVQMHVLTLSAKPLGRGGRRLVQRKA